MSTFDCLDEEIQNLQDLEKLLLNTKVLIQARSENVDLICHENPSIINEKRSECSEQQNMISELVFSDEENEGYRSGTSCFSEKQFERKNYPFSPKNSSISSSLNISKKMNPGMVTIDLVNDNIKDNKKKKTEYMAYLNKFKNK